jgi:hypothetical protein
MSTTTLTEETRSGSRFVRGRLAFRAWRWQRPFWAGLLTVLGGLPIMYFPYANMHLGDLTIRMSTTAGAGSMVIGVLMVTLGLTMWFQPITRVFAGVATLVLVLVSLVVSNIGGFLVGYLLGLFGGGMSIAWMPGKPQEEATDDGSAAPSGARDETAELPRSPAPGTGSALAGFAHATTTEGKGKHRAP